jgi:hypothetical protein
MVLPPDLSANETTASLYSIFAPKNITAFHNSMQGGGQEELLQNNTV